MSACHVPVNPATYGVGIRITFYLQWFGMIVTSWALEADALNLQVINALTTAATSIALVLNLDHLQPVEMYIVLLLTCGTLYFAVPLYLWRLMTCYRPWWDPERWTKVKMGWIFRVLTYSMYGSLLSLHIWFWCSGVHKRRVIGTTLETDAQCMQFGFLFAQVKLDDLGLVILNIIFHFTILLVGTGVVAQRIGIFEGCFWDRSRERRRWRITKNRILSLRQFQTVCDLIVAITVTVAIELVISWNNITGANDLDSAAQLIPPVITGALLVQGLRAWAVGPDSDSEDIYSCYCPRAIISNTSGPPRRRRTSDRRRCPYYCHHRRMRTPLLFPEILDAFTDMFSLSDFSMRSARASVGGYADPYASGYYDLAADYYGMHGRDYAGGEVPPVVDDDLGHAPPEPPPAAAGAVASSHSGSRGASFIEEEGFIRL